MRHANGQADRRSTAAWAPATRPAPPSGAGATSARAPAPPAGWRRRKPTPSSAQHHGQQLDDRHRGSILRLPAGGRHPLARAPRFLARERRIEAVPAARLVGALRAEQHPVSACDQPLGVVGRVAAHHADGPRLGDVLGDGQQLRHRLERLAQIVLVEPRDDHPHAAAGQLDRTPPAARRRRTGPRRCRPPRCRRAPWPAGRPTMAACSDGIRSSPCETMWIRGEAGVHGGLEDLHALPGDLRPAQRGG